MTVTLISLPWSVCLTQSPLAAIHSNVPSLTLPPHTWSKAPLTISAIIPTARSVPGTVKTLKLFLFQNRQQMGIKPRCRFSLFLPINHGFGTDFDNHNVTSFLKTWCILVYTVCCDGGFYTVSVKESVCNICVDFVGFTGARLPSADTAADRR